MIKELTSLRFVFIIFIFLSHIPLPVYGVSMATAFFFVLGGFGLTLGYKDKVLQSGFNYKMYLTRRLLKFYPLHWICLLVSLPLVLFPFSWKQIPVFFLNAALLQTWVPLKNVYFSFNAVSWYLANTMFFAIVFPLLYRLIVKNRIVSALCFVVAYILLAVMMPSEYYHYGFYINPLARTFDFIVGIYAALAFIKLRDRSWAASLMRMGNIVVAIIALVIAVSVYVLTLLPMEIRMFSVIYWIPIVFIILISSLLGSYRGSNILRNKYLVSLGESVFTLFLVHQLVIRYYKLLFVRLLHLESRAITVIICLTVSIVVSLLINKYILKPITQWLTNRILPSTTVRS